MELTIRTHYGIKTLIDIAYHHRAGSVQRRHIAMRQGIPTDYLDLVLSRLKERGLIHSFRGREGGYHLAMDPEDISMLDIIEAVEDTKIHASSANQDSELNNTARYITEPALGTLETIIRRSLRKISVGMLLEEAEGRLLQKGLDPVELMESRPVPVHLNCKQPRAARNATTAGYAM